MKVVATGPDATRRMLSSTTWSKYSATVCRSWCTAITVRPGGPQLLEQGQNRALGGHVDAGEGLVHEVDAGVLGQGAGEEDALLLAAGKLADLAVGEVADAHLVEAVERLLAVRRLRPAEPAQVAVETHEHDVERRGGEVPVDALALGHVGHPGAPARYEAPQIFTQPVTGLIRPSTAFSSVDLAGAVGADDGDQLPSGSSRSTSQSTGWVWYATVRSWISSAGSRRRRVALSLVSAMVVTLIVLRAVPVSASTTVFTLCRTMPG